MRKSRRVHNGKLWRLAVEVHTLIAGKSWRRSMRDLTDIPKFTMRGVFDSPETSAAGVITREEWLRTQIKRVRDRERAAYIKRDCALAALSDRIGWDQEARVTQAERPPPAPDPEWIDAAIREQYEEIPWSAAR